MIAYSLSGLARAELSEIYAYTRKRWNDEQADSYLQGFFQTFQQIGLGLARSSPLADMGVEGRRTSYESHYIYWRQIGPGEVGIVTVLHSRMAQDDRIRVAFRATG